MQVCHASYLVLPGFQGKILTVLISIGVQKLAHIQTHCLEMPVDRLWKNSESIIHHGWLFDRDAKINIKSWVHRKLASYWSYTSDVWYYLSIFYKTLIRLYCYWTFTLRYVHTVYVGALQIQVWLVPSLKRHTAYYAVLLLLESVFEWTATVFNY